MNLLSNEGIIAREAEMRSSFFWRGMGGWGGGEGGGRGRGKAPLSSMTIFTISTSLQIILRGGTFFIFYF